MSILAFTTPGPSEWMLILIIILVLFGAKKLPELARSLGQGMNEFRKAREEFDKELQQARQDIKGQPQSANSQITQPYQPQLAVQTVQTAPAQTQQPSAPANPPSLPDRPTALIRST